jgi:ATP-dependent helicase/nuclease subunit A
VPTKLAVSEAAAGEGAAAYRFSNRPRFMGDYAGKLTPAERGQAMHKFMQFAGYESARDNLEGEIKRMKEQVFLSAAEVNSLSRPKLQKFFSSALANRIFKSQKVMRELRFMSEFGQDKWQGTMMQGVADCVFIEDGGAVIVDYKTDRVKDMHELLEHYRTQLEFYRDILSESLETPVKACILYSFWLSESFEL